MSLKVYFDGTLIDETYYTGLTNTYEMFNESFKLGTTPCNTYKLNIAKEGVSSQPTAITLKDGDTTFAELVIDNIEEQDYEYVYTLTDRIVDLDFKYDASQIFEDGSTTLLDIATDICTKVGLILGTDDFRGYDKVITWYDNTRTARNYIGYIAELNGGFARIVNNVLYFVKQNTSSVKTISIDNCADFNIGEYHKISRVVYEMGATKYEYGSEEANTLYLDPENVYITEASEVEAIYNEMKDFEFYSFGTTNCPIDYSVKIGDVITFTDGTNDYPTIAQYNLEYFGNWIGGYKLSVNTEKQESTKLTGDQEKIKNLRIQVDRDANTITQLIQQQQGTQAQINTIVQDVDSTSNRISQLQSETNSKIEELTTSINGVSNQLTTNGGNNLFYYSLDFWKSANNTLSLTEVSGGEFTTNTVSGRGYIVNDGSSYQSTTDTNTAVPNGTYTVSFKYKKIGAALANASVKINGTEYELEEDEWTEFSQVIEVTTNYINVEFIADTDGTLYVADLLGNVGEEAEVWTQNPNETMTETVTIGKGIKVESTVSDTYTKIDEDGTRVFNKTSNDVVAEFTANGIDVRDLTVNRNAQIAGLLFQIVDGQTWISSLL